jgi:hypothetical protein
MQPLMEKAHTYKPGKYVIGRDWYWSEKLDGLYFLWDGGVTRGIPAKDVPWANCFKDKRDFISTGMWSSQGKVVHIPDEYANKLPAMLLEGERTCGRGTFQETASRTKAFDGCWDGVRLKIFGAPLIKYFYCVRKIDYLAGTKVLIPDDKIKLNDITDYTGGDTTFKAFVESQSQPALNYLNNNDELASFVTQRLVEDVNIDLILKSINAMGGEGVMFRSPHDVWMPKRSHYLLKYKPYIDDEAIIIGGTCGQGKYEGMVGALIVEWQGKDLVKKTFELSGMTDEQRKQGYFKPGERVTFRYRELSDDGIPKEARFLRRRED